MIHDMNDKMSRYNKKMGARKFPYENLQLGVANLWVSLRETMGFLTRNWWFPYEKPEASNWGKSFSRLGAYFQRTYVHRLMNLCSSAHEPMFIGKGTYVLRNILLLVMMLMGVNVWGQEPVEITTDTNGNGTIDDSEKELYLIQTNAFPSFYIAPQANNTITTNNILGDYMLWYFLDAGTDGGTQYYYIVSESENKYICHAGGKYNKKISVK